MADIVDSSSGTYISGNVDMGGGDLVGRDKIVITINGDTLVFIEQQFDKETTRVIRTIGNSIPSSNSFIQIEREEVARIENQLSSGKSVLLTGEGGSGKSAIGKALYENAKAKDVPVLFLDARRLGEVKNKTDLRNHLDLRGPLDNAILNLASKKRCRVIIDQLDNSLDLPISQKLIDLGLDISGKPGVELVIISRKREVHEKDLLDLLSPEHGFVELNSHPLNSEIVRNVFQQLGIAVLSEDLINLGENLLNLEILGKIVQSNLEIDLTKILSEIDLWDEYLKAVKAREGPLGERIIAEAICLSKIGICADNRAFILDNPPSNYQKRLISWNIIIEDFGRVFRFNHEKLQDYLYAFEATETGLTKAQVIQQLGDTYQTRNIYTLIQAILHRKNPSRLPNYLRDIWNV